jgi:hypothetical protein
MEQESKPHLNQPLVGTQIKTEPCHSSSNQCWFDTLMDLVIQAWFWFSFKNLIRIGFLFWIKVDLELDGYDPIIGTRWGWELSPLSII